jgi:glycosyltransferase involved in cell wall biosynthesis
MRILQVIHNLELAGAEVVVRDLIQGLTRRGIDCELYLLQSTDSAMQRSLSAEGVKIHSPLRTPLYSPRHAIRLAECFRAGAYDVVHVHLFPAQLWVALAAKLSRLTKPVVVTEHCAYNYRRKRVYRPIDRWIYAQCRSIACVSEGTAKALVEWLPEVAEKVRACPNGIDVNAFAGAPAARKSDLYPVPGDCPVILSIGRMMRQKDHATVIRALRSTERAHLFLVGVGPDMRSHQQLAWELGVVDRVHFLGQRTDVPHLLRAADIFVQSSRFEGFGIAALEAMASDLPVIASRVPGLAELVGDAGLLFETGDDRQLAKHLNMLVNSRDLRMQLAAAGRLRATEFSLEKTLDDHESLYRELSAGGELGSESLDFVSQHRAAG